MNDTNIRSVIKTISWRITGSGATLLISWSITGNLVAASAIATIQIVTNTILYFVHERVWNKINWGKE